MYVPYLIFVLIVYDTLILVIISYQRYYIELVEK